MAMMTRFLPRSVTGATISVIPPTSKRSGQRGMTLPEVMIAAAIVMVGLVSVMAIIPQAATNIQTGSTVSTATFLANARIDQAKHEAIPVPANPSATPPILGNVGYVGVYDPTTFACTGIDPTETLSPLAGTETDVPICKGCPGAPPNGYSAGYSRTTQVADVAGGGLCPMKAVTVTTFYRGAAKAVVSIQIAPR